MSVGDIYVSANPFLLVSPQGRGKLLTQDSWNGLKRPAMVVTGTKDTSGRNGNSYLRTAFSASHRPDCISGR